eukprot:COSAG02_NODE_2399_length_8948_cov_21.873771_1_plen_72_part_00
MDFVEKFSVSGQESTLGFKISEPRIAQVNGAFLPHFAAGHINGVCQPRHLATPLHRAAAKGSRHAVLQLEL